MVKRQNLYLLGRNLGTYCGWDEIGDVGDLMFYEFEPGEGVDLPSGELGFLLDRGLFVLYGEDGEEVLAKDAVAVLSSADRAFGLEERVPGGEESED